jgi:hypothetical protein
VKRGLKEGEFRVHPGDIEVVGVTEVCHATGQAITRRVADIRVGIGIEREDNIH